MVHVVINVRKLDFERQGIMIARLVFPEKRITARSSLMGTKIQVQSAEISRLSSLMAELDDAGVEWDLSVVPCSRVATAL